MPPAPDSPLLPAPTFAVLDPRDPDRAEAIRALLFAAYRVEERLLGVHDFPPLRRPVESFRDAAAVFHGAFLGERLAAVTELEAGEGEGLHVGSLGVRPDCFRRGLARALLGHVLAQHPGRRFTVATGARNTPAIRLYESLGFRIARRWATPAEGIPMVTLAREVEG